MKTLLVVMITVLSFSSLASETWKKFEGCYAVKEVNGKQVNLNKSAFPFERDESYMFVSDEGELISTYSLMFKINESEVIKLEVMLDYGVHETIDEYTSFSFDGILYYRIQPEIPFEVISDVRLRMLNDSELELDLVYSFRAIVGRWDDSYSIKAVFDKLGPNEC